MKNTIRKLFKLDKASLVRLGWLFLIIAVVLTSKKPVSASIAAADQPVYIINNTLQVKRELPEIKIVPGDSESTKRENAAKAQDKKSTRNVVARSAAPVVEMSFDQKRQLVRDAASAAGIRFQLLEAVWQVETGKSTQCEKNASGATGPFQFLPSTFRAYSDGGNICDAHDAAYAAARLLANAGADTGNEFAALLHYNHSSSYANLVLSVANSI